MRSFLFIIISLTISISLFSQYANKIWYFGEQAGITFNTTPPSALTNGLLQAYDNTSTITDTNGNLLFYTNGINVWDKNHTQMQNGFGLGGNLSAGQSALIVPQPNSTKYYIFTVGYASGDAFRYSIVDISLNGGNGAVTSKANSLFNTSTEKVDAIYNPNDTSYWVLTHTWNSNQYYAYKINQLGLQTTPIISSIGSNHSGGSPSGYNAIGQMTFSEDGTKLASAIYDIGNIEIFDFDLNTGLLSNAVILTGFFRPWGIAISDNNRYLYYCEWYDTKAIQMDIISGVSSTILASKITIGTGGFPNTTPGYKMGYFERGPDGKIYIAKFGQNYISSINNPNLAGLACNFVDNAVFLGTKTCNAGLSRTVTNYPIYNSYCFNNFEDSIYVCQGESININGTYYMAPNIITDTLIDINGCDSIIKTTLIESIPPNINLGNDSSICNGDSLILAINQIYPTILWSTGASTPSITLYSGGKYWVKVTDSLCSNSDTIFITNNSTYMQQINDTTICYGDNYNISLYPYYNYKWWNFDNNSSIIISDSGKYWVEIEDNCKKYTVDFTVKTKDCNCKIFIPNVFTPTNDGINDAFYPVLNCEVTDYHFYIFNRWGQLLYYTQNQYDMWDAKYNHKEVPDGVYFYLLTCKLNPTDDFITEKRGSVTVLR